MSPNIPASVAVAGKKAEDLMKKLKEEGTSAPVATGTPAQVVIHNPDLEPAPPVEPVIPPVTPPDVPAVKPEGDDGNKLSVYQGMLKAEAEKNKVLNSEVQRLQAMVQSQTELLTKITAQLDKTPDGQAPPGVPPVIPGGDGNIAELDPEDFVEYGDEMSEFVKAFNLLKKENMDLKTKIGQVVNSTETVVNTVRNNEVGSFKGEVLKAVPNYEAINAMPEWSSYLDMLDPKTGMPNRALIIRAKEDLHAGRFVAVVQDFIRFMGNNNPTTPPNPAPPATPVVDPLLNQVMPDASVGSAGENSLNQGPVVTLQEYQNAVKLTSQGKMTQEDFKKINLAFINQSAKAAA